MLQVFMTSAELHEHCFPSQELPRPKQLQIKLGDCPNLSECLSGICIGPRIKKALPIWTIIDLGLAKGFSKTALCVCCCSITLSSPEPSPEQTRACEPTARKQKQKQNLAKPGKTPDPNPIQFLSPHKEGATDLDDDRSRPCRRFLQNRFVCLLLKHNPFKSRAQPRANQSPRAHSPEPTARKQKQKQNLAKPGKTPDPNPIQFLSPHKEGATYLDDDRSRPCQRFLQNRFVCLLLKHKPFQAQSPAQSKPEPASPQPGAHSPKTKAKAKPGKTRHNPAKLRTQTLYNFYPRIKKALPIWTMIDLGLAEGFSKTALCVCC